jgi:hypothetical protein
VRRATKAVTKAVKPKPSNKYRTITPAPSSRSSVSGSRASLQSTSSSKQPLIPKSVAGQPQPLKGPNSLQSATQGSQPRPSTSQRSTKGSVRANSDSAYETRGKSLGKRKAPPSSAPLTEKNLKLHDQMTSVSAPNSMINNYLDRPKLPPIGTGGPQSLSGMSMKSSVKSSKIGGSSTKGRKRIDNHTQTDIPKSFIPENLKQLGQEQAKKLGMKAWDTGKTAALGLGNMVGQMLPQMMEMASMHMMIKAMMAGSGGKGIGDINIGTDNISTVPEKPVDIEEPVQLPLPPEEIPSPEGKDLVYPAMF